MKTRDEGWFRFYHRMIDSPEVLDLSDAEFRLLVSIWCMASKQAEAGAIHYNAKTLQRRALPDHAVADVAAMLVHLAALDLLSEIDDGYQVARWDEHQYQYPSWKPDARREQKRKERASETQPAPAVSQEPSLLENAVGNNVASVSQVVATGRKTDKDKEKDKDTESISATITEPVDQARITVLSGRRKKDVVLTGDAPLEFTDFAEQFWAAYPARDGVKREKPRALAALKIIPPGLWDVILTAARNYAQSPDARQNYAKDAFRWLAGKGWETWAGYEPPPATPPTNGAHPEGYQTQEQKQAAYFENLRQVRLSKQAANGTTAEPP